MARDLNPFTESNKRVAARLKELRDAAEKSRVEPFDAAPPTATGPRSQLRLWRQARGIRLEHLKRA